MPIRIRNWHCPTQRLLYALDRDLDKLVKSLPKTPTIAQDKVAAPIEHCATLSDLSFFFQQAALSKSALIKKKLPPESEPKPKPRDWVVPNGQCCGDPKIVYKSNGHDWVCESCGTCRHAGFEEVGTVVQFEQRERCSPIGSVYCPYDRLKHFKKVLRDVTKTHIRVPDKLMKDMKVQVKQPVTVDKVRSYLRTRKLFHYYSSANYMSHLLGDKTNKINIDSHAYTIMCREADAFSDAFDRMRADGVIKRKNFVNAHVLILRIAKKKFNLHGFRKYLRLPRKETMAKHEALLDMIADYRGLKGV